MTCIVGYVCDNGKVVIGGDSACTNLDGERTIDENKKVFLLGRVAVGMCGSVLIGNTVRYTMREKQPSNGEDALRWACTVFAPAFHEVAEQFADESETSALVGVNGRLFVVHQDGDVVEPACRYAAIGSGGPYALGALCALRPALSVDDDANHVERILGLALRASSEHCCHVAGPFNFVTAPKGKK